MAKLVAFSDEEVKDVRNAISLQQESVRKYVDENEPEEEDWTEAQREITCLERADKKLAKELSVEDKLAELQAAFKDCGGCGRALLRGYKKILLDALSELERKKTTSSPDISGKLTEMATYRAALKDVRFLIGGKVDET